MKNREERLVAVRKEAIEFIKSCMRDNHLEEINAYEIDEGASPIIQEDRYDDNNSYTLDRIQLLGNTLFFDGSSCCDNHTWDEDDISTDALLVIADEVEDHLDEIRELNEEENDEHSTI